MSTKIKSGYPLKKSTKFASRRPLTHEGKRAVAKLLLAGLRAKQVSARMHISVAYVYAVRKDYITVTQTERYPDPPSEEAQEELLPWGYLGTSTKK